MKKSNGALLGIAGVLGGIALTIFLTQTLFKPIIQDMEWFANNGRYPTYAPPHALFSYYEKAAFTGIVDMLCVVSVLINQHLTIFAIIRLLFDH